MVSNLSSTASSMGRIDAGQRHLHLGRNQSAIPVQAGFAPDVGAAEAGTLQCCLELVWCPTYQRAIAIFQLCDPIVMMHSVCCVSLFFGLVRIPKQRAGRYVYRKINLCLGHCRAIAPNSVARISTPSSAKRAAFIFCVTTKGSD